MFLPANLLLTFFAISNLILGFFVILLFRKLSKIDDTSGDILKADRRSNRLIAKKVKDEMGDKIDKFLKTANEQFAKKIDEQISTLSQSANTQALEITKFVKDQQSAVMKESQLMIANIVLEAQKEAEEYRKQQIERLESQINTIVASAAREVLGRMISITEHEDLVKQALERAKKAKFFA